MLEFFISFGFLFNFGQTEPFPDYPEHLPCWDNRADVIIHLEDGKTYFLRHDLGWSLKIQADHLYLLERPDYSVRLFPFLPKDVQLGFTMPRIDNRLQERLSALPGKSIFLKPPYYYLYENRRFQRTEMMQFWETGPFVDNRFTATLHNTSLLLVAKQGFIPDGFRRRMVVGGQVFLFDTDRFPEWIGVFTINHRFKQGFEWLKLSRLIPINPGKTSDSNYLVILDHGLINGQYYCLMKIDVRGQNTDISECKLHSLSSIFNCSSQLIRLKEEDGIYNLWVWTDGLPFNNIIIASLGVAIVLTIINAIMLLNSWTLLEQLSQITLTIGPGWKTTWTSSNDTDQTTTEGTFTTMDEDKEQKNYQFTNWIRLKFTNLICSVKNKKFLIKCF